MIRTSKLQFLTVALMGFALAVISPVAGPSAALGQDASLEGSWSGAGKITFPSGETENARCKVSFKRQGNNFGMNAVCATPSARVEQVGQLARVGGNRFAGDFTNPEYGVTGSIRITVNGNSLNASLSGGGGSAQISMSR